MEHKMTKPQLFKPGQGGRPKGALNKITMAQKKQLEWALEKLDDRLEAAFDNMTDKEVVELWQYLMEFIHPKLARVNMEVSPSEGVMSKLLIEIVPPGKRLEEAIQEAQEAEVTG